MLVAILGASDNSARYAYRAWRELKKHGHDTLLINPRLRAIEGQPCYDSVSSMANAHPGAIDTVTVYLSPERSLPLLEALAALKPRRVIANPGAESGHLRNAVLAAGSDYVEGCTLVMLATGQF